MLPFPASPRWSLCSESFLWALGRARTFWGRKLQKVNLRHTLVGQGRDPLPIYSSSIVGSRSCCEGEHRIFTTCCGSPQPQRMLVGVTCMGLESQLKSLLFTEVSNLVGNLLILFSFAASHGHDFQIFATSHALISVLNQSPKFPWALSGTCIKGFTEQQSQVCLTNHICGSVNFVHNPSALSPLD